MSSAVFVVGLRVAVRIAGVAEAEGGMHAFRECDRLLVADRYLSLDNACVVDAALNLEQLLGSCKPQFRVTAYLSALPSMSDNTEFEAEVIKSGQYGG